MTVLTVYAPGHWDYADSYGLIACQLARHLTRLGVRVNAVGMGKTVMDNQPDDVRAVTTQPILPSLGGIVLGYPTGYAGHSGLLHVGPRIALTMFESSRIPAGWVDPLNDMDAIITPSTFCRDVFRACGVTTPIHVVPLGVSELYAYQPRPAGRPLTFLAFLDRGARKGGMVALEAFLAAFGDSPDVRLILKGRSAKVGLNLTNANIEVIQQDMSEAELYQLYLSADVLINPHKGEGFGLLPREFACTGGISLTTAWSGTADDLNLWGYGLPYRMERADWRGNKILEGQDLGDWATVSVADVAQVLREVAENIDRYRDVAAWKANQAAMLYQWDRFAAHVLDVWQQVSQPVQVTA